MNFHCFVCIVFGGSEVFNHLVVSIKVIVVVFCVSSVSIYGISVLVEVLEYSIIYT